VNKSEYLNQPEVIDFLAWFERLDHDDNPSPFNHKYEIETRGRGTTKTPWACTSLYNAYEKYSWRFSYTDLFTDKKIKGTSYSVSKKALDDFQNRLHDSIIRNCNETCYKACNMILDWGGVLGSEKKGNKKRLLELKPCLTKHLSEVKSIFESNEVTLGKKYTIVENKNETQIAMNAGFTKIYSLLCTDFIIYDGRVGAALSLLVRYFLQQKNPKPSLVPESLSFYYGQARNKNVNRNPSLDPYIFRALSNSPAVHIRNNLKANWIVSEFSKNTASKFKDQNNPSRCIEAALFMIGYKV